jgi:hypothetical protein
MNWDEVGAIGQVLGSVAVFVTLGYLAVQVHDARTDLRGSISQGRSEAIRGLFLTQAAKTKWAPSGHRSPVRLLAIVVSN